MKSTVSAETSHSVFTLCLSVQTLTPDWLIESVCLLQVPPPPRSPLIRPVWSLIKPKSDEWLTRFTSSLRSRSSKKLIFSFLSSRIRTFLQRRLILSFRYRRQKFGSIWSKTERSSFTSVVRFQIKLRMRCYSDQDESFEVLDVKYQLWFTVFI